MDEYNDLAADAIRTFYGYRILEQLSDKISDHYLNKKDKSLEEKERRLNILARKRQLGLPESSEDYEIATNEDRPFMSQVVNAAGKRVLQQIPGPGLLDPKPKPFFRIAEAISGELPSWKQSMTSIPGGNSYARIFGRAASAVFGL